MPHRSLIAQPPVPPSLGSLLHAVVHHRGVQTAIVLWFAAIAIVVALAHGVLPFDRPAVARLPFSAQVAMPTLGMIEIFMLMGLTYVLTRNRRLPDMAARAPERHTALRETVGILVYAALGQAGGWGLGAALGYRPFSFHVAGTVYGCLVPPAPAEIYTWALYNFLVFALAPYVYFRRRYSNMQLNLVSTNRGNDALLVVVILAVESAVELAMFDNNILTLTWRQGVIAAPLTFLIFFVGTVLPTMVLIYGILLPRYLKMTGSVISTVLLGGLTYAAMHIVEGWSAFDSPRHVALSLIFVLFQYVGPGMFKSVLTLRTGNAWVHAVGYHAVAPHVLVDAPLIVKVFGIT